MNRRSETPTADVSDCPIPSNAQWADFGTSFLPALRLGYLVNKRPIQCSFDMNKEEPEGTIALRADLAHAGALMAWMAEECARAIQKLDHAQKGMGGVQ